MIATIVAVVALVAAVVAVALLVHDRRKIARQVAELRKDVAKVHNNLAHYLNTSARWNG